MTRIPSRRRRTQLERRLRAARVAEIKRTRKQLLQVFVGVGVYNALVLLLPWPHGLGIFCAGVADGAVLVAACWMISTRTYSLTMGTWAESWTTELFAKRKGWRVVDNLPADGYDIDHIVIAPGAVLAIETKYYGPVPMGKADHEDRVSRDLKTAKSRARQAARLLASDAIDQPVSLSPVLMLWGVGSSRDVGVELREGVWVVDGNCADDFFARFDRPKLDQRRSADLEATLRRWVRAQDRSPERAQATAAAARPGT